MLPEDAPGHSHHHIGGVCRHIGKGADKSPQELTNYDRDADALRQVLPQHPAGTEGWPGQRQAALVRNTDLIGATIPSAEVHAA